MKLNRENIFGELHSGVTKVLSGELSSAPLVTSLAKALH